MKKNEIKLSIKAISTTCGVLPQTIRTWEKRYQVFGPKRSESGQRLYSQEDLTKAKLIVALIDKGQSISKLANLSIDDLRNQLELTQDSSVSHVNDYDKTLTSIGIKKLFGHLGEYNIDEVAQEMQFLRSSTGAKEFIFKVVLPVMNEIGNLVAKGKYSVTQEHIVSTIVRYQLGQIHLPKTEHHFGKMALATPEGNIHELSIIIADIICRANRYHTSYLGAAHPAQSLAEAVNSLKCQTIILGTVSSDQWDYQQHIIPYLQNVDKYLKWEVVVILGGGFQMNFPQFEKIKKIEIIKTFEDFDQYLLAME